jgi:hypothetical protein
MLNCLPQYQFGDPQNSSLLQNIFNDFGVTDPNEQITSSLLMAEALKEPTTDFQTLPWKEVLEKYDKYSIIHWMLELPLLHFVICTVAHNKVTQKVKLPLPLNLTKNNHKLFYLYN